MRKLASIRTVSELRAIKGADRIELAIVDGWQCVIKKGEFSVGEEVVYCEIDSFLPEQDAFEFLRKSSYLQMDGRGGFRLRTIKLRGQISQGLLLPRSILGGGEGLGDDVTAQLGIVKYEPPIPASLSGEVVGPFPGRVQKTEEERVQNLSDTYADLVGQPFFVSEKLDGTSFTAFLDETHFGVCGRNWEYQEQASNTHWRCARQLYLEQKLRQLGRLLAVQGELIGPKIQGNRYRLEKVSLFVFNIFDLDKSAYVDKTEMRQLCDSMGLEAVPALPERSLPPTIEEALTLAEGKSVLHPEVEREGLVWVSGQGLDRVSFKTISNHFLAKES